MKILVAIANFGTKNAKHLVRLLKEYRSMTRYRVDIVVLSNIPKHLGSDIEVIVGLPTNNPWSLPFGYKKLFFERAQQYDLFIYSEDDTLITERNIDSFVNISKVLPGNYIAGFIRYEISESGKKFYSTIHAHYHWDHNSVVQHGEYIFARYTNDHSGCFILTQSQLKKSIQSGGFLLPPRMGRYDMLVTAATDPYTQCGMKKVICISHLDDFCLHHLPNVYCGKIGVDAAYADLEIEKLKSLKGKEEPCGPLFDTSTSLDDPIWDKEYYEQRRDDILSLVPRGVRSVLSIGCGHGTTESELVKRGIRVVGIPLDCVIQESAAARGIKVLVPNFEKARKSLKDEQFDCILFPDVLQHLPAPVLIVREFLPILGRDGSMIFSVPNFNHPSVWQRRILGDLPLPQTKHQQSFAKYKVHFTTRRMLCKWLKECELTVVRSYRSTNPGKKCIDNLTLKGMKGKFQENIVVLSKRESSQ